MQITILPGKNMNLESRTEDYIVKRIESLEHLISDNDEVSCEFRIGKNSAGHKGDKMFFSEAKIITPNKAYGARAESATEVESIDAVKDELGKKIRRHKDKKITTQKKSGRILKDVLRKFFK